VASFLLLPPHSRAASFVVSHSADTTGYGSLRAAVLEANRRGGANAILLTGTNYLLTLNGIDEDSGKSGDLDITRGNLFIIGRGAAVTIDASGLGDRIFQIFPGARVTFMNVTFVGGKAFGDAYASWAHLDGDSGGAIHNAGNLLLNRCRIKGNSAGAGGALLGNGPGGSGGRGGGICNVGTVALVDCVIDGNSGGLSGTGGSGGDGGGICNAGFCVVHRCTLSGNNAGEGRGVYSAGAGAHGGDGGAVFNSGQMLLSRCTISGNRTGSGANGYLPGWSTAYTQGGSGGSSGGGAGIYNSGRLRLVLCTVSGNTNGLGGTGGNARFGGSGGRGGDGGGIHNSGDLVLTACTVVLNKAGQGGAGGDGWNFAGPEGGPGGAGGRGGGVVSEPGGFVRLRNTLLALNTIGAGGAGGQENGGVGVDGLGLDVAGSFSSQGYNLIGTFEEDAASFTTTDVDLLGTISEPIDPFLRPLEMNGGATATHALLPGSPALDQGKSFGLQRDQRQQKRRYDYPERTNSVGGDSTDIGAFELRSASQ
jgi:hypothetical protein